MELASVEYDYTRADLTAASMHIYDTNPAARRLRYVVQAFLFACAIAMVVVVWLVGLPNPGDEVRLIIPCSMGFGLFFGAVAYPWVARVLTRAHADAMFRDPAFQPFFGRCRVTLTEEGMESRTEQIRTWVRWDVIGEVNQTPAGILIKYVGTLLSIPRSAFASDAEYGRFADLLQQRAASPSRPG